MTKNTDLHTHSYYSDGLISPKELVRLAKKRGIKNLALTDHDSVKGVREAINEGKRIGVTIIPAVEIRTGDSEVLGYFINLKNKELTKVIKQSAKRNEDKTKDWCKKLNKAGYDISFKEIQEKFPKARGNINTFYPLYLLYLKGYGTTLELSKKFKKDKKLKPKEIKEFTIIQAIRLIKKANGVPVLAHPWFDKKALKEKNFKKYVKAGLKGIEINNGDDLNFMIKISKNKNIVNKIKKFAKKHNLILTSGSDFHGEEIVKLMPGNHQLGENNCNEKIVKELKRLSKN